MTTKPNQVQVSLSESAYSVLKHEIMENILSPGYQEMESEIALRLGMSRTPVREAAIRLSKEGLLEITPRKGIRVKPLSVNDMKEIYELLVVLESEASSKVAMLSLNERYFDPLINAVKKMEKSLEQNDLINWAKADDKFHRFILALCPNKRIVTPCESIIGSST